MENDGLPAKTFANESPGAVHTNTQGGPSAIALIGAVRQNPAMTLAIVAIGIAMMSWGTMFFLYNDFSARVQIAEREARLAQNDMRNYEVDQDKISAKVDWLYSQPKERERGNK